jgi:hypothetical protein
VHSGILHALTDRISKDEVSLLPFLLTLRESLLPTHQHPCSVTEMGMRLECLVLVFSQ